MAAGLTAGIPRRDQQLPGKLGRSTLEMRRCIEKETKHDLTKVQLSHQLSAVCLDVGAGEELSLDFVQPGEQCDPWETSSSDWTLFVTES